MQYAQTNVQLYQQLLRANWAEDDLRHVQSAYRLALRVVASHYHASERPFLAHLVGVASVLAHHGAHGTVVSAGLLHSVYEHGDFGDGSRGLSESRRRAVRRAVGAASEELIARYATLPWSETLLSEWLTRAGQLSPVDGAVAWMKLADLLECGEVASGLQVSTDLAEIAARLAAVLGHQALAAELIAVQGANPHSQASRVPEFLSTSHRRSFAVAPLSHGVRPGVRLLRLLRRVQGSLLTSTPFARRLAAACADN
jgi:(p)ppGpp synthase/HD superfamily hydrolase